VYEVFAMGTIRERMERRMFFSRWFRDGGDEAKDGEEDFDLFGTGTISVEDGEEDILVLVGSDCRMGLRGWDGLRLPDSYETGVGFSHPRMWNGSGPG
jgi:hypothetical protein